MRVLVTGSSGFIAAAVDAELEKRGHEGIAYDRPHGDITNPARLQFALKMSKADAIINLAGMLGTSELFTSQHEAVRVNIAGALNVFDLAAMFKIPVVQIGTGHKGQPNTYAITKAAAEDLALARAQWCSEQIAVVRAYHVYGPGQKRSPVRKFFPAFACAALTGQPLDVHGTGNQVIDPVHVTDVARVLVDAISGPYGTVTEAGCGKPVTVAQAAADIIAAAGSGSQVRLVPMRPGEPEDAVVIAGAPACGNPWPYLVPDTIGWYRNLLEGS